MFVVTRAAPRRVTEGKRGDGGSEYKKNATLLFTQIVGDIRCDITFVLLECQLIMFP